MQITVVHQTSPHFSTTFIRKVLHAAARVTGTYDAAHAVVVTFLPDTEVRILNAKYRKIDRVTDVLSFTYTEESIGKKGQVPQSDFPFGELVIAPGQMQRQAGRRKRPMHDELRDLLIHGYLHLLGHDHHKAGERKVMRSWEDKIRTSLRTSRS